MLSITSCLSIGLFSRGLRSIQQITVKLAHNFNEKQDKNAVNTLKKYLKSFTIRTSNGNSKWLTRNSLLRIGVHVNLTRCRRNL